MTALVWDEAPIAKRHDRAAFDCGDADLNLYLQKYARQNHESGGAKCFVAAPSDAPARVLGFYTLSPGVARICADAGAREERPRALRRAGVPSRPPRRRQLGARPRTRRRSLAARRRSLHPRRRKTSAASPCSSTPRTIAPRAGTKAMALSAWTMRRFPSSCRSPSRPTRSSAEFSPASAPDFCDKTSPQNQRRTRAP